MSCLRAPITAGIHCLCGGYVLCNERHQRLGSAAPGLHAGTCLPACPTSPSAWAMLTVPYWHRCTTCTAVHDAHNGLQEPCEHHLGLECKRPGHHPHPRLPQPVQQPVLGNGGWLPLFGFSLNLLHGSGFALANLQKKTPTTIRRAYPRVHSGCASCLLHHAPVHAPCGLQVLPSIPSPRAPEYAAFATRILSGVTPATQFVGSKAFHRCDYYSHHRPTFFTTVHMYGKYTLNAGACWAWPGTCCL